MGSDIAHRASRNRWPGIAYASDQTLTNPAYTTSGAPTHFQGSLATVFVEEDFHAECQRVERPMAATTRSGLL